MSSYILNKNDLSNIKELIKTSQSVQTLYSKLSSLSLSGDKESKETYLKYLSTAIEVENNLYGSLCTSEDKSKKISEYICGENLPNCDFSDRELLYWFDNRYSHIIRIRNRINTEMFGEKSELPKNVDNLINKLSQYVDRSDIIAIKNRDINFIIKSDLFCILIMILDNQIDACRDEELKNKLIFEKFNIMFMMGYVDKAVLTESKSMKKLAYPVNNDIRYTPFFVNQRRENYNCIARDEIESILKASDQRYFGSESYIYYLRQAMLRATLQFLSDENICELQDYFNDLYNNGLNGVDYSNNAKSTFLIKSSFGSIKTDREKIRVNIKK